ncbi:uncharacterized protein ACNS7B_001296 isoform 2-T2 [Menidia menidia]
MASDVDTDPPTGAHIPEALSTPFPHMNSHDPRFPSVKLEDCEAPSTSSKAAMQSPIHTGTRKDKPTCNWSKQEVLALLTYWASPAVQLELLRNVRNNAVYSNLSAKLSSHGFNKSAQKCKEKIKKLKQDYRRIKNSDHLDGGKTIWFDIIDEVLSSQAPASTYSDIATPHSAEPTQSVVFNPDTDDSFPYTSDFDSHILADSEPGPMEKAKESDYYFISIDDCGTPSTSSTMESTAAPTLSFSHTEKKRYEHTCSWSKKEVHALLAYWANPAVQQELQRNVRNNAVYGHLSARLASLGFDKSAQKCKEKLKKLKQDYRRIKNSQQVCWSRTAWFGIMDEVLSSRAAAWNCPGTVNPPAAEPHQSVGFDLEADDETQWTADEVQVLITLWAQPNIQRQLLSSEAYDQVFPYLSNELALVGFNKTPQQCSLKVKELKEEYRRIKEGEQHLDAKSDWFAVIESVLGSGGDDSKALLRTAPESPKDPSRPVWTSDEVDTLLTRWAEDGVQERLRSDPEDERVYALLSSELATQGFHKTTGQCRAKIRLLRQEYERGDGQKDPKTHANGWFGIMDRALGRSKPAARVKTEASESVDGCRLSLPSLCLLVPTLRLMCAFAWQVVQRCNVAHYQKVEELVRSVAELAPELLTPRERVQLLLTLRARLVLELCRGRSAHDQLDIQDHLRVIQDLTMSPGCAQEELEELENSKSNFVEIVCALLNDPDERERFFTEVFPIHYGQQYESTLQRLVWKFISRLDNLLPIPDIKQTAAWLSSAPSVMEECEQLVLKPEHLKALMLFHDQQTGGTNKCSENPNLFLPTLSLRPKGKSKRHLLEGQEVSISSEDQPFDASRDESMDADDKSADASTLELLVDESEELNDDQSDDLKAANCLEAQRHGCAMCPYSDADVSGLLTHIREEHLTQDAAAADPDSGQDCGEILQDAAAPDSPAHTPRPSFQCSSCEKRYASKASLTAHQRLHTGQTPYLCPHCGQGFRSSSSLDLHVRTHTGERPHRCHVCGKTSIQHLARHMRMHRGEKNHPCAECGKAFLSSGELKLHTRSHTGERPHTCKQCGKGFVAKCHLTVHARRHTGESPYRCALCPKSFATLKAQKKHQNIHSSKKSFQCLKCGKIFRQEDTFKFHIETHSVT